MRRSWEPPGGGRAVPSARGGGSGGGGDRGRLPGTVELLGVEVKLKWLSLVLLIVQNTALVLLMRFSRVGAGAGDGALYLTSTAVVVAEVLKLLFSLGMLALEREPHGDFFQYLTRELSNVDFVKLAVPGLLYTVQNNLLFVALSNLEAAVYQVTYQLKILTTALFSVSLLGRSLNRNQVASLGMLTIGVALVQLASAAPKADAGSAGAPAGNRALGLTCVLSACVSSGFAGVYTEKIIKHGRQVSLFMRNVQLALFGVVLGVLGVLGQDASAVSEGGFFQGYNGVVWGVVVIQAAGGLMIAMCMKYADNILKGFATSISIILSSWLSAALFGFHLSAQFMLGAAVVIAAVFLFGHKPAGHAAEGPSKPSASSVVKSGGSAPPSAPSSVQRV